MMSPSPRLLADLQSALDHGGNTHTLGDLRDAIRRGEVQVWGTPRTVCLTELVYYPQLTALRIWLVAGVLEDCDILLPDVEAFARDQGCTRLEATGRAGWRPWCRAHGYDSNGATYRKELT